MREYVGCGPVAERAAQADLEARRVRDERRAAERAEREALEDLDRRLVIYHKAADGLTAGVLVNAGYHRHKRGEWRHGRTCKTR